MDLEHLTKHQIILLTLLVSFVTSIATGIVTVSLMNQAPPSVTRTINQIVERTVQTVIPSAQPNTTVSTKVVIKDDDLITQSIAAVQKSIVRITAKGGDELLTRGIIIDTKGTAITDRVALEDSQATEFEAILASGQRVAVSLRGTKATTTPFLIVTIASSSSVTPSPIADTAKLRLGQSVMRIGGRGVDTVAEGVISMLPADGMLVASVHASVPGSVLVTRFGEIIGLTTSISLTESSDLYAVVTPAVQTQITKSETKPATR